MNTGKDKRILYQEILQNGLDSIKKLLNSKKDSELIELIEKGLKNLEQDRSLQGDNYLDILKKAVENEN